MSTTYARRKAAGRCPYCGRPRSRSTRLACEACAFRQAKYRDRTLTQKEWASVLQSMDNRQQRAQGAPALPGPAFAHCGLPWQPITTLPACCGRCGAVVVGEE